jgi:hypothetical protein
MDSRWRIRTEVPRIGTMAYIAADCPNCGAESEKDGSIECAHCHASLVVTDTPLPAPHDIESTAQSLNDHGKRNPLALHWVIGLVLVMLASLYPVLVSYFTAFGRMPGSLEYAVGAGVLSAVCVAILWAHERRPMAKMFMVFSGCALFFKPIISPYLSFSPSHRGMPYGFDSETHMFFWVPGLLLLAPILWLVLESSFPKSE